MAFCRWSRKKNRCCASTVATITDVTESLDIHTDNAGEARRYKYIPTYSYRVNGQSYIFRGIYAYDNKKKFHMGDTAQLWYDPNNPQDATIQAAVAGKSRADIVMILLGAASCVLTCIQLG